MDNQSLNKFFGTAAESEEQIAAYIEMRTDARALAATINRLLPESPSKADVLGRLFRVVVDAELAVRVDGVSTTKSMLVMQ